MSHLDKGVGGDGVDDRPHRQVCGRLPDRETLDGHDALGRAQLDEGVSDLPAGGGNVPMTKPATPDLVMPTLKPDNPKPQLSDPVELTKLQASESVAPVKPQVQVPDSTVSMKPVLNNPGPLPVIDLETQPTTLSLSSEKAAQAAAAFVQSQKPAMPQPQVQHRPARDHGQLSRPLPQTDILMDNDIQPITELHVRSSQIPMGTLQAGIRYAAVDIVDEKRPGKQNTVAEARIQESVKAVVGNERLPASTEVVQAQDHNPPEQESSDNLQPTLNVKKPEISLTPSLNRSTGMERLQPLDAAQLNTAELRMPDVSNTLVRTSSVMRTAETFMLPETISIRQPGWDQALGNNVLWMIKEDLQSASIRVKPAELGPMNIQVSVQQDQVNVNIAVHQGAAREALEAALPRLREQFAAQGFQQVTVDISHQQERNSADARNYSGSGADHSDWSGLDNQNLLEEELSTQQTQAYRVHDGLLDAFA